MRTSDSDTIAAIATPSGEGGIGIIRISGPEAHAIGKLVFPLRSDMESPAERFLHYGHLIDPGNGALIDDGFIVFMEGPRTYTGEDVAELQLHGGQCVLVRALTALFACGARPAEAGEFTKRAFLSGRIDLTQAEAVMDVIKAGTPRGLASAEQRLNGALRKKAGGMSERLLTLITRLEAEIEFAEDMDDEAPGSALSAELEAVKALVEGLLASYAEGSALRSGQRVLILGRPNVGKSSLLNLLLGEERAIVTHIPGTTRDVIEEAVNIHGIAVALMDTAGLRETPDFVESLGVRAARERIEGADVVVFVFDASQGDFREDKELLKGLGEKKVLLVGNKLDKIDAGQEAALREEFISASASPLPIVFISALEGKGLKALEAALYESITGRATATAGAVPLPGEFIATLRQREALLRVLEGVERAAEGIGEGRNADLMATELRAAQRALKELTGEVTTDDILDQIFSSFCIGK